MHLLWQTLLSTCPFRKSILNVRLPKNYSNTIFYTLQKSHGLPASKKHPLHENLAQTSPKRSGGFCLCRVSCVCQKMEH